MRRGLSVCVVWLVGAVGCSSLAGPPAPTTLTGLWSVTIHTGIAAGNTRDTSSTYDLVINFTQLDSTFTGVATGGQLSWYVGELPAAMGLGGTSWTSGLVSGTQVSFQGPTIVGPNGQLRCFLTGGTMSSVRLITGGAAMCELPIGLDYFPFNGTWSAMRVE